MPLRRGEMKAPHGFAIVLRNPLAIEVHVAEIVPAYGITLLRSLTVPANGFGVVLRHILSVFVHVAESNLSFGIALLGTPYKVVNALRHC